MTYKVVIQNDGRDREVLYWNGALSETIDFARKAAVKLGADRFRIAEYNDKEEDVYLEAVNKERDKQ